jgi:hypothetical protein
MTYRKKDFHLSENHFVEKRVNKWRQRAQLFAVAGGERTLEGAPEILDEKSPEEEHGEDISIGLSRHAQRVDCARLQVTHEW